MDSVTQIALGASVAATVGFKPFGRNVLLVGALLGTVPDLDIFINYGNAIDNYTSHRGFSHSLFVLTLLSIFIYFATLKFKPHLGTHKSALFLVILLPLITHPLLDAFTTYGTQLLWPLTSPPISWNSIFIIDPLYTIPLLVSILFLWFSRNKSRWISLNRYAFLLSCIYLAWGQFAQTIISNRVKQEAPDKEAKLLVMPTPFNTIYWRVLSYQGDHYHEALTYVGDKQPLQWTNYANNRSLISLIQLPELQRLEWFSHGWLHFENMQGKLQVTDLRLGITGFHPFTFIIAQQNENGWSGIEPQQQPMDPKKQQQLLEKIKKLQL